MPSDSKKKLYNAATEIDECYHAVVITSRYEDVEKYLRIIIKQDGSVGTICVF